MQPWEYAASRRGRGGLLVDLVGWSALGQLLTVDKANVEVYASEFWAAVKARSGLNRILD